MTKALTLAATKQEYRPEWFCAEWFNCSFDFYTRQNDQEQWAHAFGIGSLYPTLEGEALDNYAKQFRWYYGPNQGTPSSGVLSYLNNFYSGIHMAGPKLTPQTFQAGLYSKPMMGGAKEGAVSTVVNGYGPRKGMAYPAFSSSGTDASLWWWNPDVEGFSNIFRVNGKGKAMWVDGAKRYLPGDFPKDTPFFDETKAIAFLPSTADDQLRPPYDCTGCPSETAKLTEQCRGERTAVAAAKEMAARERHLVAGLDPQLSLSEFRSCSVLVLPLSQLLATSRGLGSVHDPRPRNRSAVVR